MKNFLYKFEFYSGVYECIFYRQINAKDQKDAIIQIVAFFIDKDLDKTKKYIAQTIGEKKRNKTNINKWTVADFWKFMDMRFFNGTEGYYLIDIKEINFDLDNT